MIRTTPVQNKELVLQAFDTLFNKQDYKAAERYWSSNYLQQSAHISPGRDGLFNLVRSMPASLKYEPALIVAENDYVIASMAGFRELEGPEIGLPPMSSG
jgi:predicted SnoaL-like aldol condensation-catalyzing enzyme